MSEKAALEFKPISSSHSKGRYKEVRARSPLLARLGCTSEEERDKTDAIKAMKLTRNSSLAARESAVTLLTVLESPIRILLIIRKS